MIQKISNSPATVSFYTLGCRLNQAETAAIQNSLDERGFRVIDFSEPADIVVINTCTVTEGGDSDTRKLIHKINRLNPRSKIALIGCQAQIQKKKLTELQNVTWVVGNARKMDLADILLQDITPSEPQVITPTIPRDDFSIPVTGVDRHHTRANLKIQDGCDFFCSFCEIPYARGRARSREFSDILREAEFLADAGHKELVITGINVGTYRQAGKTILDVITALEQLPRLERIRISSIEPTTIPHALIQKMKRPGKLCPYLHVPLQSGDDAILQSMKRKYTSKEFLNFILSVKNSPVDICVGTDVIVGFPGENDSRFNRTYDFLLEAPVDYFHVFSYSQREMAKSRHFSGGIDRTTIRNRSERLRELGRRKRLMFHQRLLGTVQEVLFEETKDDEWSGLTGHYIRVRVKSKEKLHNQIRPVRLRTVHGNAVTADLITKE